MIKWLAIDNTLNQIYNMQFIIFQHGSASGLLDSLNNTIIFWNMGLIHTVFRNKFLKLIIYFYVKIILKFY